MAAKVDPEELKMWQILYPCYINANRTIQEGRRLPKEKACVNPSLQEIKEICDFLKVPCVLEPTKVYSRNTLLSGRARVLIKKDGKPVNPDIPSSTRRIFFFSRYPLCGWFLRGDIYGCAPQERSILNTVLNTVLNTALGHMLDSLFLAVVMRSRGRVEYLVVIISTLLFSFFFILF
eukprot:TRINITY_DN6599_c0_g1_i1.p1 TRINITY_DN6599_c0_g1~~TRINITY_DN6599_c0_g1_i1.p1  ORF type:complete len:190 (-),score=38.77 TRINITY_DN6599_c0_g1_i1:150-680(-)